MDSGYTVSYRSGYTSVTPKNPHNCYVFLLL